MPYTYLLSMTLIDKISNVPPEVSVTYQSRTCSVPAPYILQSEVLLSEECTEQVHPGYGWGTNKQNITLLRKRLFSDTDTRSSTWCQLYIQNIIPSYSLFRNLYRFSIT